MDSVLKEALAEISRAYRLFVSTDEVLPEPTFTICFRKDKLKFSRGRADKPRYDIFDDQNCVMPIAERRIHEYLLEMLDTQLLVHAAAVSRHGRVLVMPAAGGGGKTTLTGGLVKRGCGYLTDELVIIHPTTGLVMPFPKALSVKPGSFSLFGPLEPDPTGPPRDRVWYLDPDLLRPWSVVGTHLPIYWVIFPRFETGASTRLERLTTGETVLGLFGATLNIGRHKYSGVDLLVDLSRKARGYRLIYGSLRTACDKLLEITENDGERNTYGLEENRGLFR